MKEFRYKYLENLLPDTEDKLKEKYWKEFTDHVHFVRANTYEWRGMQASSLRELWLMGILFRENIEFVHD